MKSLSATMCKIKAYNYPSQKCLSPLKCRCNSFYRTNLMCTPSSLLLSIRNKRIRRMRLQTGVGRPYYTTKFTVNFNL